MMAVALCFLSACEDRHIPEEAKELASGLKRSPGFIAFVGAGPSDPVWPILKRGAEQYIENGGALEVRFFSPVGGSAQDQVDLLERLNDPDMRGLCIQIIDVDAIRPILHRMYNQGTLIVSMLNPAPDRICVAHVGFDDEAIGQALARLTVRTLGDSGSMMLLHAGPMDPVFGPRLRAFEREIAHHRQISVLAKLNCRKDPREARNLMRDRSSRYPRLSAWVALGDWPIRDVGRISSFMPPGCRFITFGGTPDHWLLIQKGISPGVVAANYRELGLKAAHYCESAILRPSQFKDKYTAPLRIVAAANLDQYIRDWTFWSSGQSKPEEQPIHDLSYDVLPSGGIE